MPELIVVDTSSLIALERIGLLPLLCKIYSEIIIPEKEVVRYGCTHGFAHRDSYDLSRKHVKEELYLSFEDALTLADDDIDDNWETYKLNFLKG